MFQVISIGHRDFSKSPIPIFRREKNWELFCVHHGHFGMLIEDQKAVFNQRPTVWISGPNLRHGKIGDGSTCHVINLTCQQVPDLLKKLCSDHQSYKIELQPDATLKYLELSRKLSKLTQDKHPLGHFRQNLLFQEICLLLLEQVPVHKIPVLQHGQKLKLENAFQWFKENMNRGVSVSQMAASIHLSESHFRRLVRQTYHKPVTDILQQHQIENAQGLLRMGNFSVERIAEACGYGSSAAFSRAFKRTTKMSPLQWKQQL